MPTPEAARRRLVLRPIIVITSVCAYAASGIFAGTLGFWLQDRELPIISLASQVLTPEVRPGSDLQIQWKVYRRRAGCPATAIHVLRDSAGHREIIERVTPGLLGSLGEETFISRYTLPNTFVSGPGTHTLTRSYRCNPIHAWWPIVEQSVVHVFKIEGDPVQTAPVEIIPR